MKTVCLIEVSNGGHREAFMQLFVKALVDSKNKVVCIMPNTTDVEKWILENLSIHKHKIQFHQLDYPHDNSTKFSRFEQFTRFVSIWKYYKNELKKIEEIQNIKIDFVFWNCLDGFVSNYFPRFIVDYIFPYKWSGLFFHPNYLRVNPDLLNTDSKLFDIDNCLKAKNCIGVTIHDESLLEGFQKRLNKKVILFPETADNTPPDPNHLLAKEIINKAKGRIILGIIGLEPNKGTLSLIRLVAKSNPSNYFFVFTGYYSESFLNHLTNHEKEEFILFKNNIPENCLWQTGSLKEGSDYNSVFCSFDIIYIVYNNFYSSSNRLTKASIFKKLVLANNYGCVGDDVPKYNLGETVDENDIDEQYQKLELLRNRILAIDFPEEQWKIYAAKHSTNRLKEKFEELLNLV